MAWFVYKTYYGPYLSWIFEEITIEHYQQLRNLGSDPTIPTLRVLKVKFNTNLELVYLNIFIVILVSLKHW